MGQGYLLVTADMYTRHRIMKKIVVRKRHSIRKGQAQDLIAKLEKQIGQSAALFKADMIEVIETNADVAIFLIGKKPLLMDAGEWVFPTLRGAVQLPFPERRIVVDSGAIPYVVNGADVMRPGIVSVTPDVVAGAPVQVVEEKYGKPLAIAIALKSGNEILQSSSGKMCKSFHHVGDEIWALEL